VPKERQKAETVLNVLHKNKRAMRFGRCLWPTIEKKLCDWVVKERAKGRRISTVRMLQESKRIAQEDNMKDFKAYPSWVFRFMKRNNLSVRFSTSVGQKLPSDWEAKVAKFSEMEEGMEKISKLILNVIDSFNVESDAEFLGFE
jgi:hypothetical protein